MAKLTLQDIKPIVATIKQFYDNSKTGETKLLFEPQELDEINGIWEDLYMTHVFNNAILIHYADNGDWTKALLIPEENFTEEDEDNYSPADEAIEWFFE